MLAKSAAIKYIYKNKKIKNGGCPLIRVCSLIRSITVLVKSAVIMNPN